MPDLKDLPACRICFDLCTDECDRQTEAMAVIGGSTYGEYAVLYDDTDADTVGFRNDECHYVFGRRSIIQCGDRNDQQQDIKQFQLGVIGRYSPASFLVHEAH